MSSFLELTQQQEGVVGGFAQLLLDYLQDWSGLEVERAWARARRPGPDFGLAVNKPQARGSASLIFP